MALKGHLGGKKRAFKAKILGFQVKGRKGGYLDRHPKDVNMRASKFL